jgi:hypothetical protein
MSLIENIQREDPNPDERAGPRVAVSSHMLNSPHGCVACASAASNLRVAERRSGVESR